jgi:ribonuclease BN (tRNA processing enzyme)
MRRPVDTVERRRCNRIFGKGSMKIRMLGTGSGVPSLRRVSAAYLVSAASGKILIDIGPSVVRRLLEFDVVADDVDVIILTHFHPDHTVDLATFLFACNYGEKERRKPLLMIGGRGVRLFYGRFSRLYPWVKPIGYPLTIKTLSKGKLRFGNLLIETAPVNHRDESIAIRLEENGRTTVFSGDTDYSPTLLRLASGSDVLFAECSHPWKKAKGHMNLETLRRVVDSARPRKVLMTHLYPEWEEFKGILPAPLLLGEDGMEIQV